MTPRKSAVAPPPEGSPQPGEVVKTSVLSLSRPQPKDGAAATGVDVAELVEAPQGGLLTSPGSSTALGPTKELPARPLGATKAAPRKSWSALTFAKKEKKRKWIAPEE